MVVPACCRKADLISEEHNLAIRFHLHMTQSAIRSGRDNQQRIGNGAFVPVGRRIPDGAVHDNGCGTAAVQVQSFIHAAGNHKIGQLG